jgi:hypothetical protein
LEQKMITTVDAFAQGENAHTPKIKNVKRVNKNSLIAAFDIEFPTGFVIRRATLLERQGQRWIGLPEQSPSGFLTHSFAGDDPLKCRDHVKERLGWRERVMRGGRPDR